MRPPILVLGLGNPLRGDDGLGPAVVRALQEQALPPDVEVLDGGTAGLGLLEMLAGRRRVVVVDVAETGRPPGTIVRQPLGAAGLAVEAAPLSLHQLGLAEVLALAGRLGMAFPEGVILAVQPASLGWEQKLSRPVQGCVPALVEAVLAEIGAVHRETCRGGETMAQEIQAKKILVIDDDPDTVEVIRLTLESAGYEVISAADGQAGLKRVVEDHPDLIILDVMMDTTTAGFHFSLQLRSPDPDSPYAAYRHIPIMMLTAIHTTTPLRFGPDSDYLPVDDFVEKPISPEALLAKVAKLLE